MDNYRKVNAATCAIISHLVYNRLNFEIKYSRLSEAIYMIIPNKDSYTGFASTEFRISCHKGNFTNEYNELIVTDNYETEVKLFIQKIFN